MWTAGHTRGNGELGLSESLGGQYFQTICPAEVRQTSILNPTHSRLALVIPAARTGALTQILSPVRPPQAALAPSELMGA